MKHHWATERGGYLYVIDGSVSLDSRTTPDTGDAIKVASGPEEVELDTDSFAELILIDTILEFDPVGVWTGR